MKHYIKIAELIGTDIRSRNNAKRILEVINTDDEYTLDFTSVEFMSRSFTDELCNIIDYNNNVTIDEVTMERQIEDIYTIVNRGRQTKRKRAKSKGKIIELNTSEEVRTFFASF